MPNEVISEGDCVEYRSNLFLVTSLEYYPSVSILGYWDPGDGSGLIESNIRATVDHLKLIAKRSPVKVVSNG